MHPLEKEILAAVRRDGLIMPGDRVLAAVSGGPDSMALLHLLARLASVCQCTLCAAYVNHGLRPEEAAREEVLVRDQAYKLQVDYDSASTDVMAAAGRARLSVEHAAREERYRLLRGMADRFKATKIALGHTADDQAEELLLRLIRGTGRMGLSGMRPLRDNSFIRPLLRIRKARLLDFLAVRRIPFLQDSSNQDPKFLRNRVRRHLLPLLAARFNPGIYRTLRQTADILLAEEVLLEAMTRTAWNEVLVADALPLPWPSLGHLPTAAPRALTLDVTTLRRQPMALQRRIVEIACWQMEQKPQFRQVEQVLGLVDGRGHGRIHLGNGLRARRTGDLLVLSYPEGPGPRRGDLGQESAAAPFSLEIPGPGHYPLPTLGKTCIIELLDKVAATAPLDQGQDLFDWREIEFPLTLRSPRPGDRFRPLGAPGSKKVGDFLTDRKVPVAERWQVPVLVSHGTILALLGLRLDHRFRLTPDTSEVMRVSWQADRDWVD